MLGGDNLSILQQEGLGPDIKAAIWLRGGLCPGWLTYFWDRLGQSSQVEVLKAEFNYVCLI